MKVNAILCRFYEKSFMCINTSAISITVNTKTEIFIETQEK